jgi:GTPase
MQDEVVLRVRSGNGGPGCVSFRREKYIAEGGPDGGDGGAGGDVILLGTRHRNTLGLYAHRRHWKAQNGQPGMPRCCFGKDGKDVVLELPLGTLVHLTATGELIADITTHGQKVVVAVGGKGGWGNVHFKKSTNQVPRQSGPGYPGQELELRLSLKLIADVGIIGFPNAGKSTLLSRLSAARPKIAPYPFTTLEPQLGVIEREDRQVVLADIPGLIEGAAEGLGLGHKFLRHIERCALLLHLVDGSEGDAEAIVGRIRVLDAELARFSQHLAGKPQLIVLNKRDARPDLPELVPAVAAATGREVLTLSGVSGEGLAELTGRLLQLTQ